MYIVLVTQQFHMLSYRSGTLSTSGTILWPCMGLQDIHQYIVLHQYGMLNVTIIRTTQTCYKVFLHTLAAFARLRKLISSLCTRGSFFPSPPPMTYVTRTNFMPIFCTKFNAPNQTSTQLRGAMIEEFLRTRFFQYIPSSIV